MREWPSLEDVEEDEAKNARDLISILARMWARLLALSLLAAPTTALVLAGGRPLAAPRAACAMALPKISDAKNLSDDEISQEIFNAKKELFELRKGVRTRQNPKPHLFTHTKHRIAQLNTLLAQRQAS